MTHPAAKSRGHAEPTVTHTPETPIRFPTGRFASAMLVAALVAGAVGVAICVGAGRSAEWLGPCVAGLGVALLSFLVSLEPMRRGAKAGLSRLLVMSMVGMGLRVALILIGIAALVHGLGYPSAPTALFAVSFYLVLMAVDVPMLLRVVRAAAPPRASADAPSATPPAHAEPQAR